MTNFPGTLVPAARNSQAPDGARKANGDVGTVRSSAVGLASPQLHRRRVLITGACGFIGRHLTRHLLAYGADVHALVRPETTEQPPGPLPRVHWHRGDLGDAAEVAQVLDRIRPEVVFHLASRVEGHRDHDLVLPMLEDNLRVSINVMSAALRRAGCRVVLAGSVEEPHTPGEAPCSPYAATKAATTGFARLYHAQWDLPVTVLRLAMVYGPDQPDARKLVPHVITHLLAGQPPPLSSGSRGIDWTYIDDVCDAFVLAAIHPDAPGRVLDIGSGTATTVADTVALLTDLLGQRAVLKFGELPNRRHDTARIADLTEARTVLGWEPRTPLTSGLANTVHWYLHQGCRDRSGGVQLTCPV